MRPGKRKRRGRRRRGKKKMYWSDDYHSFCPFYSGDQWTDHLTKKLEQGERKRNVFRAVSLINMCALDNPMLWFIFCFALVHAEK